MKKIILVLSLLMGILLVGCGSKKDEKKVVYVGTNAEFAPFEFLEGDKVTGFDMELIAEIGKVAGFEVEVKNQAFDGLLPALQSGKIDLIIAGMTVTDERKKAVDFSESYYTASQVIIVPADNVAIKSFDDLKGKNVGVQIGTTGDTVISEIKEITNTKYNNGSEAVLALTTQKVDAVVIDNEPAKNFVAKNTGLKVVDTGAVKEDYAIAIAKGNKELLDKVNTGLKTLKEKGKYDELIAKWFK